MSKTLKNPDCPICALEAPMDDHFSKHDPGAPDFSAQALIGLGLKCLPGRNTSDWPGIDSRMCKLVKEWCR
ncbi:hypothetical protein ColLi_12886 [Colletotrichum liriopes]|uniref:Uncharacterized protein n=1 Tax=Colletotrichum liriopes TaxID=708192 RepID=A0AA37GZ69_9PEZI|nr:hypothetical protein ColLi_12886 [Colletotrichum liriopes]